LWERLDPLPIEKIDKKHCPKTGAAMTYADGKAWLLVGNKQPEFWCYTIGTKSEERIAESIEPRVGQDFNPVSSQANLKVCPTLSITPNPFTELTTIRYNVATAGKVSIKLYTSTGKLISTLIDEYRSAGSYTIEYGRWSKDIPQGVYFLKYESGMNKSKIKLIVQ
jgi:hypothetical protein